MRRYFPILILICLSLLAAGCTQERLEPQWQLEGDWAEVQAGNHCSEYIRFRNGYYEKWKSSKTVDMSTGKYRYAYLYMDHRLWGCDVADWTLKERHRYTLADGNVSIEGKTIGTFRFVKDTLRLSSGKVLNYLRLDRYEKTPYTILDLDTYELPVGQPASVQSVGFHISRPVQGWYDTFTYSILSMDADRLTYDITMEEKDFVFHFMDNPSYRPQQSLALLCLAHPFSGTDGEKLIGVSSDTVAVLVTHAGRPVQSLSLDPSELSLKVGGTGKLTATVDPSDADVLWTSDNPSVASVDATGQVKALAAGKAVIKILAGAGDQSAACTVTVGKGTPTFSIAPASLDIASGKKGTVTITSNSDCAFTVSSSNPSVATVSVSGKTVTVTGVKAGTATVTVNCPATANYEAGGSLTCSVVVYNNRMVFDSPANCYIVSSPGAYSFKTVKGNSTASVGSVSKAEVLWESFGTSTAPSKGDIIKSVSYSGGNISFSTPATLKNGNAVIAAKDASGNILWSWHIWVCKDYDPAVTGQAYYNNAGVMMDRNLGATSATPGDVGALGLLYQWGRKDPFLGSSSISSSTKAKSTLSWPSAVSSTSSNGTVAYAVAHPTIFIYAESSTIYDWVYSSRDNKLWQSSKKTIYDPCPPGWKVPGGGSSGAWSKAANNGSFSYTWNSTNRGMNFSGKFGSAGTIWYPAAGCLDYDDGSLKYVGYSGYSWSCTPSDDDAYSLSLNYNGNVYLSNYYYRASGRSVRCLQE